MGWTEPKLKNVIVINTYESEFDIPSFLTKNNGRECVHIFSGINAFPIVHQAFKFAIKLRCRVGVFTEPLDFRGLKGKARWLRGFIHKLKWGSQVEMILPTGSYGVRQFLGWGYPDGKIFEWAYTVKKSESHIFEKQTDDNCFRIMFAGSLIARKGYDLLIQSLQLLSGKFDFQADFYCLSDSDTQQGRRIVEESNLHENLKLLPFLPNSELRQRMNDYDLFVLPSRHDGWGAVVSESLMEGTPVVVSKACGSSSQVIHNNNIGSVVKSNSVYELTESLKMMIKRGKLATKTRKNNRMWAETHISGEKMASYFNEIIMYIDGGKKMKPRLPWM